MCANIKKKASIRIPNRGFYVPELTGKFAWLREADLNHRPSGYEGKLDIFKIL
jgi:hypothetical protein